MVLLARKDEEGNTQTLYDHLHGAGRLASGFEDEFADIHVSGEHLSVKRKRFLKKIIATTDFCNYQSRFIAYK